jgi:Flp pilus assembly CpaE family ATPase
VKANTLAELRQSSSESIWPHTLSVASVGPDQEHRQALARAFAESGRARVVEVHSYPKDLDELQDLLRQDFDIILVDIDNKPAFSLELVKVICTISRVRVMVYSRVTDQNNVLHCMNAGASEYLTLPLKDGVVAEVLDRTVAALNSTTLAPVKLGTLSVCFGAKGGSGVTTIACNLAIALVQETSQRTLIIDLGRPMGDAALNLGIAAKYSTDDAFLDIDRLDQNSFQSLLAKHGSGISVLAAPSHVPEIEASKSSIDKLIGLARREFDHVIVDVGSRTDLIGTALFDEPSRIYFVTQAGISELRNSNRLISQFFNQGNPNLEIVINRFEPRSSGGGNEDVITKALGKPLRWKIPDDEDATRKLQNSDTRPSRVETPLSRVCLEMARSIASRPVSTEAKKDPGRPTYGRGNPERRPAAGGSANPATRTSTSQGPPQTVAWPTPDPIAYGEPLSDVQLNATASVPGTFDYTPRPGYVLPVGTHTLWVTFNSADCEHAPVQSAVTIEVSKATPRISWPAPPMMASGTALGATELNAEATVPGIFEYAPAAGEVLPPGTHTLSVTFTPANTANYKGAHASVEVTVDKVTPVIHWQGADTIPYGTPLDVTHLNATASVPGTFEYSPRAGEVLSVGKHTIVIIFDPADSKHYARARATVSVIVIKAKPVISWPTPDPIAYGTALGDRQLSSTASVPGTFEYTPGPGAMLGAGEHTLSVLFAPTDTANYSAAKATASLSVQKMTPVMAWPTPEPIGCGTALSTTQLNATASVPGIFEYAPAVGKVLPPGTHDISVTFTPIDRMNYSEVRGAVTLTVTEMPPAIITWHAPSPISYGVPLGAAQLNATSSNQGTFVYTPPAGIVLAPGRHTLSVSFTPTNSAECTSSEATVTLEVTANHTAPAEFAEATSGRGGTQNNPKTRTYKGAVYVQGEDGQWHLQQK